jgi:hypothetical protein
LRGSALVDKLHLTVHAIRKLDERTAFWILMGICAFIWMATFAGILIVGYCVRMDHDLNEMAAGIQQFGPFVQFLGR